MLEFEINTEHSITIPFQQIYLDGFLHIPHQVVGVIIFAHGSGSSRLSPRNQFIAKLLQQADFATLLFDLLTVEEEAKDMQSGEYRFNINFLSQRLLAATEWIAGHHKLKKLPIGYFGASTGAAAALSAAAVAPSLIKAVVSRGGRPDLADFYLPEVKAPTLLIVGGEDKEVIRLNQLAYAKLKAVKHLEIISGATHLFEEPGKLSQVGELAKNWFGSVVA